ncbi:hypothetical protein Gotri_000833, partial [Gossypium trilobum]|nr:hypothetical protein [Gossypium trilobum]
SPKSAQECTSPHHRPAQRLSVTYLLEKK